MITFFIIVLGIMLLMVSYLYIRQNKKSKIPLASLLLVITALSVQVVHASVIEVKDWSIMSSVQTPTLVTSNTDKSWYIAEIPGNLLNASRVSNFQDIRLVDTSNTEVPYVLIQQGSETMVKENSTDTATNTKVIENSMSVNERVMVLDTLKEGEVYTGIKLSNRSDSINFRQIVHVYISDARVGASSPSWRELEQKSVIYNYTDQSNFKLENLEIKFPSISSRYIKLRFEHDSSLENKGVTISNRAEIVGARMKIESESTTEGSRIKEYLAGNYVSTLMTTNSLTKQNIIENTKENTTEIIFSLPKDQDFIQINSLTLGVDAAEKNFKRNVTVQVQTTDGSWSTRVSSQIYRIASSVFNGESLSIPISMQLSGPIRVLIHNDNDTPLRVEDTATVHVQQRAILFKKDDSNVVGLTFLIGNKKVVAPTYEIQKTLAYFSNVTPTQVALSESRPNPLYTPMVEYISFGERYKYLINIGLIVFVLVLGCLGYRWSR